MPTIWSSSTRTVPGRTISPASTSSRPAALRVTARGDEPLARRADTSDRRLLDELDIGGATVEHARLLPHLDGEAHHDDRLHQVHQGLCVVGHLVPGELRVQVDHHIIQTTPPRVD